VAEVENSVAVRMARMQSDMKAGAEVGLLLSIRNSTQDSVNQAGQQITQKGWATTAAILSCGNGARISRIVY
jgi:hypothetical protein